MGSAGMTSIGLSQRGMERADALFDALARSRRVLLTGPAAPDGDSIGACLALARVLGARLERTEVAVAGTPPERYRFLPGAADMLSDEMLAAEPRTFDAVVILDGDQHRLLPGAAARFAAAEVRAIVDHHASTTADGYTHAWLDPSAESASGMLLRAFRRWEVSIDAPLATLLYAGIVFDTGGFRHSNTTPETHRLAADLVATGIDCAQIAIRLLLERTPAGLRAMGRILAEADHRPALRLCVGRVPLALQRELALADGDLEGVVDALVNTVGAEVGALLVERADGAVKYSLCSRGGVDVAWVARQLHPTGGGHPRAAGAVVCATLAEAEQRLNNVLEVAQR